MRWQLQVRQLGPAAFVAEIDRLNDVYAAAMRPDPALLPGRRGIMERHTSYRDFRALAMMSVPESANGSGTLDGAGDLDRTVHRAGTRIGSFTGTGTGAGTGPGGSAGLAASPGAAASSGGPEGAGAGIGLDAGTNMENARIIAFGYGFRGLPGQWWHDVVRTAVVARSGEPTAAAWLDDSMEVAELHVHPDFQHRGIGRQLLLSLTNGRGEQTAALSTPDTNAPALRLYRGVGFADLLTGFIFPGGGPAYTVLGAALPLRGA